MITQKHILVLLLIFTSTFSFGANISSTGAGGDWDNPATWSGNTVPGASDDVSIINGATVTLNTDVTIISLTIDGSFVIGNDATARNLTVTGTTSISGTGSFTVGAFDVTHAITFQNTVTNDGIFDLFNSSSQVANVTLDGNSAFTVGGNNTPQFNNVKFTNGVITAGVSFDINGSIIIETGATFTDGDLTHNVAGNWTENGTGQMTGNGTINMDASLIQSITDAATFYNLTYNGGSIGVIGAGITVTNNFLATNNTEVKTSQSSVFQGDLTIDDGSAFKATAGTSTFNSANAQTITIGTTSGNSNVEFWNAYFDNGGSANSKTIDGNMLAQGLTYIYDDAELGDALNDKTQTLNGLRVDGTCTFSGTIISTGGTFYDDGGDGDFTVGTADIICEYLYVGTNDIMRVNGNVTVGIEDNTDYNYLVINNGSQLIGSAGKTLLVKDYKSLYVRGLNNFPSGFGTTTLENLSFVRYDQNIDQTIAYQDGNGNPLTYGHLYLNNNQSDGAKTKTAAGGLTVNGNVYIYNLSNFALVNYDHHFKGHIVNTDDAHGNGSITTTGGTVYLDAPDANQYIYNAGTGSYNFNNLEISNSAPTTIRYKRLYNDIIINGNFTATNTGGNNANRLYLDQYENLITGSGTSNFNLGENVWLLTNGENNFETSIASFSGTKTFHNNSTVRFNRTTNGSHQNIPGGFSYGNIEIYGANEKLPQANLDVNGSFSAVGYTPILKDNSHTINVYGDWNMHQNYTDLTATSIVIFDGVNQDISNSNFSYVYFNNSGTKTISGTLDVLKDLVIQDGVTVNAGDNYIYISGNWDEQNGQFTQTGGYVIFDGATANQTVNAQSNSYFFNFQINKSGANKLVTLNSKVDVNGTFNFVENNAQLDLNGQDLHIARNFYYREGCSFTHNNGKVFFDGNEGTYQLIRNYNTDTIAFNDVEFSGTLVKRLYENAFRFEGDVFINNTTLDGQYWDHYVEGDWINTGIFRHSNTLHFDGVNQNISASSFHSVRFGGGANTKTLSGDISLTGNLWIDDATLDVGTGNNSITLDDYWHNDSTGSFNPRQGTVTVTGEYNRIFTGATNTPYGSVPQGQVITQGGDKSFYNLTINATNEDYWMFIHGNLTVLNNFKVAKGRFYQSYDPNTYGINDIYVGGDFINKGSMYSNNYGEKLELNPSSGSHIFEPGSSNTYSITNFNGAAGTSFTFESNLNLYNNRAITISDGDLDLNSNKITTNSATGNITMNGGSLEVDSAAIISMGSGSTFTNNGGTFKLVGHQDDPASLIATTGNFSFLQTSGTIHAQNFRIQGTAGNGIEIQGGTIDATNTFQNGSFSAGIGNSYLTTTNIDLGGNRTITGVTFNSGPTYNVERTAGNGAMIFENATGTLAGYLYENDDNSATTGEVQWSYPGAAFWDGGGDGTHWNDAANWVGDVKPTSSSIVILDHGIVAGAYTVSLSTIADGFAKSISINSNGTQIELNLNGQQLTVDEDITIGTGSVLTQTNTTDIITIGGSWSNAGTFNEGTSTVVFNPVTGTHTITTQGAADSFYNLTINGTGGTNVVSSTLDVNGDVNLQAGILNAGTNTITVAGDWTRGGGSVFNIGTSTVNFDGTSQNINGGEFYNFTTSNSGTKTATANIDIDNSINIGAGTVFDGGTNIIYVGNDWTNNVGNTGFTQTGAGSVILDGESSGQDISNAQVTTFNHLIISGTQTKYTRNNITINGNLIINNAALYIVDGTTIDGLGASNTLNMNAGRIYVNGANNFPQNFETINLAGGTVDYYANIDQTIYPTEYYALMIRRIDAGHSTTKTVSGDITVNNSLYVYDNETLLDVDEHTINLWGNLSLATGGRQIDWGTNGTLIHFGEWWTVDTDIDFLNNVVKKNLGYMNVRYKSLEIKGDLSILEDAYLQQDTVNITCTGANKTFTLAATAYVNSYNPETLGASTGRKAFPVNFTNYNLHKDSRVYIRGTLGDQEIYTIPNYGNLYLYTSAEINISIDGNLDVEGSFGMYNEPTLMDAGYNMNFAGANIDIRDYNPSGATTMTFDGADQRIYDAGSGATIFDTKNVVFAGSGQKSLHYSGDDWYNVTGNLTINNGVTVYIPRRLDFSGSTWLNNGTFNHTAYTINFNGTTAQSINPGIDNNFYSVAFLNSGTKTFTNNGINVNNGTFTIDGSSTVDMATGLTHYIASERITNNGGTWVTENAHFVFDRNGTQYIPAMVCKNLTFRRYDQWNRVRYLEGAININDLNIEEGTQLRCSQNAETTTATYNVTITGNFTNDGYLYSWGNTFAFESDDNLLKTIKQGNGSFHNVTFNQSILSQNTRTYSLSEETRFYEDLTVGKNATLDLNGQILRLGNDDPNDPIEPNAEEHIIQTDGTLDVDEGASLIFSCRDLGNPKLDVEGTLKIVGTNGNNATVTSTDWHSNAHRIDININDGGSIFAQYYLMKYLSDEGLFVHANATIDATNNFSDGTWSDLNTGGGTYLWCNADVSGIGTVDNVTFNYSGTPTVGTHFNVKRDAGSTGVLTFDGTSSGLLAGKTYEADDSGENNSGSSLIEWPLPSEVSWIGGISTDWFNADNWSPATVPTNLIDAIIPIKSNNPIIFNAGAQCKDLKISDGFLTLQSSNDLTVSGDVYVGSGTEIGILAIDDATCSISVKGNWTRAQNALFVHGDGTVIFNAGGGSVSIDPRDSEFGNITFNGGATFMLNRQNIYIDHNLTISSGTVQPIVNNYNIYIKGNYNNSGGLFDNTTHGIVYFDGTNNQTITNADLWAVTIDGSANKTTAGTCEINGNLIIKNATLVGGNPIDMNNYVTIEATGGFDDGGFTHTFSGYRWTGTGVYSGNGIIEFDRDGYQQIAASSFNSLLLKNNGGVTLQGNINMTGDLSLVEPNTYINVVNYQVTNTSAGTGTFSMADARRIYVRGANNFPTGFNSYDFHRNSYTMYDGTMAQIIAPVPIVYGRVYLDNSAKTAGGHLDINGILYFYNDASLDVTTNNYRINLQDDWYNTAGATFIPREGEVIFDGNDETVYLRVYDDSKNTNPFYDLTVNKGAGSVYSYWTDVTIQNNLRAINGRMFQNQTMYVGGDMSALSGTFGTSGTYYLNKSSGSSNLQLNNSTLYNLTINSGAIYTLQDELKMNGNYNLIAGTFDGNGQLVRMGDYGESHDISGLYKIGEGGTLQLPSYGTFNVNSGGEVDVVGAPNNISTVTNYNGRYYFNIESGGTIKARNYLFEYMAENGIYIKNGGIIDNNYNFSQGTFTNSANGGTCLRIENIQDFTEAGGNPILEVSFPNNPNGGASNVTKSVATSGTLDFKDYSGEFAGEDYDNDPSNIINWISPPFVMWTGHVDNDWYKIGNWEVSYGADRIPLISDNVIITKQTNQPIIDHDDAVAKTLEVQQNAILTLNTVAATDTTLVVAEDVSFDGTIVMTSASDTLTTGGNWNNSGMFIAGEGTVIFNSPFGIKTIDNRSDFFNNLYINTPSNVQLFANTTTNGNFIVKQGNFDLASYRRVYTVKGDFLNYGSIITQNGKIVLAGNTATQVFNPGTSTYYNIDIDANSGTTVNLTTNDFNLKHNLNVNSGTFDLNNGTFNMGDGSGTDVLTINGGTFNIDENAHLKQANNSSIEVNNGGTFKLLGIDSDNPAYLQAQSGSFGFNVNSGATIHANFYNIQNTNTNGITINSGASIDGTNNFSNGMWQNGTNPGQYLNLENDFSDFTVTNVYFHNGASINVKRTSGTGVVTFEDALGLLAGANFEEDIPAHGENDGKILWTYTHDQYSWTGNTDTDWNVATNWDVPASVDASGHAVPNLLGIALIPDVSATSGNFPTLGINAGDADGTCFDLKIEDGASLTINNNKNLDIDNSVTIFTGANFTVSAGSVSDINVADTWSVDGTFSHGFSSTVILDAPAGKLVTISGNNSFYNLRIASTGNAEYTTGAPIDMDGFFDVASGTFTVQNVTDTLFVGGDLSNTGTFNHGNSLIILDGNNQNISNTGTGNFYNLICSGSQNKILTSDLTIENDIEIKNNSALNGGSHNLTLFGDWINKGTFNASTSLVSFEGTETQIIQNYNQETFYDFTVNNTASTFPQIILYGDVDVTGNNWTMTDGIIETSSTEMLTIYSGVILFGGDTDASYVSGPLTKIGDQNFTLPIGKGTKFARLGISALTNPGTFVAEYFEAPYSDIASLGVGLDHVSGYEHWTLDRTAGTGEPFVTFYWEDGTQSGIDNLATLTTALYTVGQWENKSNGGTTGTIVTGSIASGVAFDSFGPCGFAATDSNNPLHGYTRWTGDVSTVWNNLDNWTSGVPSSSKDALVPAAPTNQPLINIDAITRKLTIDESASLIINPLKSLTTEGKFTLNGSLLLKSDNTGNASLINKTPISYGANCDVKEQLYLTGFTFHHLSTSMETTNPDRFKSDPVAPYYNHNFFYYDEHDVNADWTAGWHEYNGATMSVGEGYTVYYDRTPTVTLDRSTSGNFNSTDVNKTLTYTGGSAAPVIHRGWNFVGNPFPAYLDWDNANWTKNNIYNSVYFWNGSSYSYYVGTPGEDPHDIDGIEVNGASKNIPPMQGFFVKVKEGGDDTQDQTGSITIPLNARTTDTHAYWKTSGLKTEIDVIRITVSGNDKTDETAIRFVEEATSQIDADYDAFKLFPGSWYGMPQIYSITSEGINAAINSLPGYYDELIIPVGFQTPASGIFTINIPTFNLDKSTKIYFEDIYENKIFEISNGLNYSFNSEDGEFNNRFRILFSVTTDVEDVNNELTNVNIYSYGTDIYLNSQTNEATLGDVEIVNISGAIVYHSNNTKEGLARINFNKYPAGTYIVKLTNEYGVFIEKVFVMKN